MRQILVRILLDQSVNEKMVLLASVSGLLVMVYYVVMTNSAVKMEYAAICRLMILSPIIASVYAMIILKVSVK